MSALVWKRLSLLTTLTEVCVRTVTSPEEQQYYILKFLLVTLESESYFIFKSFPLPTSTQE